MAAQNIHRCCPMFSDLEVLDEIKHDSASGDSYLDDENSELYQDEESGSRSRI